MSFIFCNKSVSGKVETVEVSGYPGVTAQVTGNAVANIQFADGWDETSAKLVVKTLLDVDDAKIETVAPEVIKTIEIGHVTTLQKNDDLMIQLAWGYVSRKKGETGPVVDHSRETMSVGELSKGVHHFMKNSRQIRDNHTKTVVGYTFEGMVFDDEVRKAVLGLGPGESAPDGHDGFLMKNQFTDRAFWNDSIKTGKKLALSLGGRARRTRIS